MVRSSFSAAHRLREYEGKCEALHGHNWKIDIFVRSTDLDEKGLAIDFRTIKEKANDVISELDHSFLNDLPFFQEDNPSSERIAQYIYRRLSDLIDTERVKVVKVTAWESDNACASYLQEGS